MSAVRIDTRDLSRVTYDWIASTVVRHLDEAEKALGAAVDEARRVAVSFADGAITAAADELADAAGANGWDGMNTDTLRLAVRTVGDELAFGMALDRMRAVAA